MLIYLPNGFCTGECIQLARCNEPCVCQWTHAVIPVSASACMNLQLGSCYVLAMNRSWSSESLSDCDANSVRATTARCFLWVQLYSDPHPAPKKTKRASKLQEEWKRCSILSWTLAKGDLQLCPVSLVSAWRLCWQCTSRRISLVSRIARI